MSSNIRDMDILRRIIHYCDQIWEAKERFGCTLELLRTDEIYRSAISMFVLQIGELTTHLSDNFKADYAEMPWQDIKLMRNVAAHRYSSFDMEKLFETIMEDIPELREYCQAAIQELEA